MSARKRSVDVSEEYKRRYPLSALKVPGDLMYTCDPCRTVGDHAEAKGFCTNCEEYLCDACFKCHSRSKLSRHHALLDKDNMPRKSFKLCDSCKAAGNKVEATRHCTDFKSENCFCSERIRAHERSERTVTKGQHALFDKDDMPRWTVHGLEDSISELRVCGGDGEYNKECKANYTYLRDVNIKDTGDETDCYIAEMTLVSNTELLLTDYNNKSLKLVDVGDDRIKHTLGLLSPPIGITTISKDQVAVVLENESKVLIILIAAGLFVVRTLNTNGNCVDIKHINGNLYVSFWEPLKLQILQPTGGINKTIRPDHEVRKHCVLPSYIDVSPDESLIYLSDWKTKKVLCIDTNGNMISMYRGELKGPADVTIAPSGSVYLCDRDQHVVYKLTSDLREATVIIGDREEETSPHALCFNADKQYLYISSGSAQPHFKNYIRIYHWK